MSFAISETPIDPQSLKNSMENGSSGACVTFEGWTRNQNEGKTVRLLEYSAYKPLAEKEGARILQEALDRFEIEKAVCVHRVGTLEIGDIAVWVGASSAHRGPAFEACRYIIDETKTRVPIWKKEHYQNGDSGWINAEASADSGRIIS